MHTSKTIAQNVGVDMAKDFFVACLSILLEDRHIKVVSTKEFKNTQAGFRAFLKWLKQLAQEDLALSCTLESTGVYHEKLTHYLYTYDITVFLILATHAKRYKESFPQQSKNDYLDARSLASMGLERRLKPWKPSSLYYKKLKSLTRERADLQKEKTRLTNKLKAMTAAEYENELRNKLVKERINLLKTQIKALEKGIKEHLKSDPVIAKKVENILTIPSVGWIISSTVLAETNGFAQIQNRRQLISYAGYAIKENQSGNTKGPAKLSKKGNKHIRRVLYMASYYGKTVDESFGAFYERIGQRYHTGKVAGLALQRKILTLIYTLWNNDTTYFS